MSVHHADSPLTTSVDAADPTRVNLGASLSGMSAARTQFDVAAHNVANLNTDGFAQQRVDLAARPDQGGVDVQTVSSVGDIAAPEGSSVSISEQLLDLAVAKHMYDANAQILRTIAETHGAMFDTRV